MTQPTQDGEGAVAAAAADGRPFPGARRPQAPGPAGPRPPGPRPSGVRPGPGPGPGPQPGRRPQPDHQSTYPQGTYPQGTYPGGDDWGPETDQDGGWLLPTPEALAQYERVQPGMADRILALAENEARYRWEAEPAADGGSTNDRLLQLFALVIIILFFAAAVYLTGTGKQVVGCILGVVDLVALISVFVTSGRRSRR